MQTKIALKLGKAQVEPGMSTISTIVWMMALALVAILIVAMVWQFVGRAEVDSVKASAVAQGGTAIYESADGLEPQLLATGASILLAKGDTITAVTGTIQITYFDGQTTELLPGASMTIQHLEIRNGNTIVEILVNIGRVINRVKRTLRDEETFKVNTKSSVATVRGTVFIVETQSETASYFATNEGVVRVTMDGESIDLLAGQEVEAITGQPLLARPQSGDTTNNSSPAVNTSADQNGASAPAIAAPLTEQLDGSAVVQSAEEADQAAAGNNSGGTDSGTQRSQPALTTSEGNQAAQPESAEVSGAALPGALGQAGEESAQPSRAQASVIEPESFAEQNVAALQTAIVQQIISAQQTAFAQKTDVAVHTKVATPAPSVQNTSVPATNGNSPDPAVTSPPTRNTEPVHTPQSNVATATPTPFRPTVLPTQMPVATSTAPDSIATNTAVATAVPTIAPTVAPTVLAPTVPTVEPTVAPTATPRPTDRPNRSEQTYTPTTTVTSTASSTPTFVFTSVWTPLPSATVAPNTPLIPTSTAGPIATQTATRTRGPVPTISPTATKTQTVLPEPTVTPSTPEETPAPQDTVLPTPSSTAEATLHASPQPMATPTQMLDPEEKPDAPGTLEAEPTQPEPTPLGPVEATPTRNAPFLVTIQPTAPLPATETPVPTNTPTEEPLVTTVPTSLPAMITPTPQSDIIPTQPADGTSTPTVPTVPTIPTVPTVPTVPVGTATVPAPVPATTEPTATEPVIIGPVIIVTVSVDIAPVATNTPVVTEPEPVATSEPTATDVMPEPTKTPKPHPTHPVHPTHPAHSIYPVTTESIGEPVK